MVKISIENVKNVKNTDFQFYYALVIIPLCNYNWKSN